MNESPKPISIFYSYAREDEALRMELDRHLATLKRSGLIRTWSDSDIVAGVEWDEEIAKQLNNADIILLLISPDFLYSDYLYSKEMQRALSRHERGECLVIPIILRPSEWHDAPFSKLQVLPKDGKAVTDWKNRDAVFSDIAREIREVVQRLRRSMTSQVDWVAEGNKYMELNQYTSALSAYEQAIQLEPSNAGAHTGRGNALRSLGKYRDALIQYEQAIRLESRNIEAYINRGNTLRDLGRLTEALTSYNLALSLKPDHVTANLEKGHTLFALGRIEETLAHYDRVLQLDPANPHASFSKGNVFRELGQYEAALAAYNDALQLAPNDVEIYFSKGEVLFRMQRYEQAVEAYRQTILRYPEHIAAHLDMGEALRHLHRDEEALAEYDVVIMLEPSNARAYQTKAIILYDLGRDEEALLSLQQARNLGLNIENDPIVEAILSKEIIETPQPQTRIDFVQQFLTNAGFDLRPVPNEVGILALARKPFWKTWFYQGLYIRVLFDSQLDQRIVDAIVREAKQHRCDHALVIINQQPKSSGWAQVNILRGEQGARRFICLPIDEALIQKGIATNSEFLTLQHYIQDRLGEGFDPYDMDSPVTGVVNFFGRQNMTDDLLDGLRRGRRLGLFGIQKMGKSSMLKELQLRASFPVAYVYLEVGESLDRIYKRILEEWAASGRVKYPEFKWISSFTTDRISQSEFDAATKNLLTYLGTIGRATPLLGIFLDEIEHIVPSEGDEKTLELYIRLMDSLRGLHQETQCLSLLVAGVHPSIARYNYLWGKQKNPMHQIIKEYFLSPLDEGDCINMIRSLGEQINVQYEEGALKYILEMSGSHPLLARRICSLACKKQKMTDPISVEVIEKVVREFVRDPNLNSYLGERGLWRELSQPDLWGEEVGKANHELLLRLAEADKELSEDDLCNGLNKRAALDAFYALRERSIIFSPDDSGYYRITFGLFKNWIRFRQLGIE